ncbi:MAG: glucosaminidase domain-containing protein [Hyphomicrobium sp.]|nr:glucosaminidase domain-containing protein [Hyphomicrobium sp.]
MRAHTRASVGQRARLAFLIGFAAALATTASPKAEAQTLPEIRTHERNRVPACVTPERLMQYLERRNQRLAPQFRTIARYYKAHGDRYRVRWDYAFYQMLIETNFLTYRAPGGKWGDVKPSQNNFAGIGATGGGVPGDRYPDVSTGVLAQVQHLVAYSGEIVENPVARRTRDVQQKVVELSRALGRPVTWRDLAGRWAVDRKYAGTIASVAARFHEQFCDGTSDMQIAANDRGPTARQSSASRAAAAPAQTSQRARALPSGRGLPADEILVVNDDDEPTRASNVRTAAAATAQQARLQVAPPAAQPRPLVQAPAQAERPRACKVWTASYGGSRNVLIQTIVGEELHLTALQVLDGQEEELAQSFIETHALGGTRIGDAFPNREAALIRAFDLCPQAARLQR